MEGTPPPTFVRRPDVLFPPIYMTMKVKKKNPESCKIKKESLVLTYVSHLVGRLEEDQLREKPIAGNSELPARLNYGGSQSL